MQVNFFKVPQSAMAQGPTIFKCGTALVDEK